jgi:serine/threonine protein kinase
MLKDASKGQKSLFKSLERTIVGMPHTITEGIPGLFNYLKGQLQSVPDIAMRLQQTLSPEYLRLLQRLENNRIDGLSEKGIAPILRKQNTDFGSKYQGLQSALAKFGEGKTGSILFSDRTENTLNLLEFLLGLGSGIFGLIAYNIHKNNKKHNKIQGLNEKGLASKQRKENTDFGSGWDPVRALARLFKQNYTKFLESGEFQTALEKGKLIKVLSTKGKTAVASEVALYETSIKGEKFQYIRKQIPYNPLTYEKPYEKAFDFLGVQTHAEKEILTNKVFLTLPKKRQLMPTTYGHRRTGKYLSDIYQEYIPGKSVIDFINELEGTMASKSKLELMQAGGPSAIFSQVAKRSGISLSSVGDINKLEKTLDDQMKFLYKMGISHGDMNAGNMMLTSKGPGLALIDWGGMGAFSPGKVPKAWKQYDTERREYAIGTLRRLGGAASSDVAKTRKHIDGLKVSKVSPTLSDWRSPWQGPTVSGDISEAMVTTSNLGNIDLSDYTAKDVSGRMAMGKAPTMVGITGTPSPNLPNLNDNLSEQIKPMTPGQLGRSQMTAYLQDNVPLSTKIRIKGRINDPLNINELSQSVSTNMQKSKVNIYINDDRSKLTEQQISDMIEK